MTTDTIYQLPHQIAAQGWQLEYDAHGWCHAVHPVYGSTRQSYPTEPRGLKFTLWDIENLTMKCEGEWRGMVTAGDAVGDQAVTMRVTPSLVSSRLNLISEAYNKLNSDYHRLGVERDTVQFAGVCNGRAYYRNIASGVALYANHPSGVSCPLHGPPPENGRLRVYIGKDSEPAAQECLAAMNRLAELTRLQREQDRVKGLLDQFDRLINDLHREAKRYLE